MQDLCFITTCRGRLANLKQSLPTFVGQVGASCVVVDYDCPEGTAKWVGEHYPVVRVVRVTQQPRFELAKARNVGAEASDAPWLCFVDADVRLAANFAEMVRPLLADGHYYRPAPRTGDLCGTCICHRDDFRKVEGYDDVLQGWGKEDLDLYTRLQMAGARLLPFPGELLQSIPHEETQRVENYEVKNRWLNASANHVYCRVKWDMMRLSQRNLSREMRARLYEQLCHSILAAHADGKPLEVAIPAYREDTWSCGPLEARLVYRLNQPRGNKATGGEEPAASSE